MILNWVFFCYLKELWLGLTAVVQAVVEGNRENVTRMVNLLVVLPMDGVGPLLNTVNVQIALISGFWLEVSLSITNSTGVHI